ncbi:MAG: hypothetical protein QXZ06_08640 [Candidatus Jordarchaeales archaeon]
MVEWIEFETWTGRKLRVRKLLFDDLVRFSEENKNMDLLSVTVPQVLIQKFIIQNCVEGPKEDLDAREAFEITWKVMSLSGFSPGKSPFRDSQAEQQVS